MWLPSSVEAIRMSPSLSSVSVWLMPLCSTFSSDDMRSDDNHDFTIFVGDRLTRLAKGYRFVRFEDEAEQLSAMREINGVLRSSRPMRSNMCHYINGDNVSS
ncbi:hypothetical protein SLA2020_264360 [Shorea laevis]